MIAYAIVLLTDLDDVNTTPVIEVQLGVDKIGICAELVKAFVVTTNKAYERYPGYDCLRAGLEFVPPTLRPVFAHLFEKLGGIVI